MKKRYNTTTDMFRKRYSSMEEMAIIRYFLENGGYVSQRGNAIWKMMEEWKVCPDRTWMSMKHHWDKWIHPRLNNFGVTVGGAKPVMPRSAINLNGCCAPRLQH